MRSSGTPLSRHLDEALAGCREGVLGIAAISAAVNLLMFAGPLYMLQVYDRVLSSRSLDTLLILSLGLGVAYLFQALFDALRGRVAVRIGRMIEERLAAPTQAALLRLSIAGAPAAHSARLLRDVENLRQFASGPGPGAFADLPWIPVFFAVCFLMHPAIGAVAGLGTLLLVAVALLSERSIRAQEQRTAEAQAARAADLEALRQGAEAVSALGMAPALAARIGAAQGRFLAALERTGDAAVTAGALSRALRQALQSAILGVGAVLVIAGEMLPGAMIAASILAGRALAPVETAIGQWRQAAAALAGYRRLRGLFVNLAEPGPATDLPRPQRSLAVEDLAVLTPQGAVAIRDMRFALAAGEALAVVGPSGAGKSALLRALAGIWPAAKGAVRLDGADLMHWSPDRLGPHLGYLGQEAALFSGTVAENIARLAAEPASEAVVAAAQAAGALEMIQRLPQGFDTRLGEGGAGLSAGQRQRIGLARALYGEPFLVVLDEPNANLDSEGEAALARALAGLKARGAIVVLATHRPSALGVCDKVLVLAQGQPQAFGPRAAVLKKLIAKVPAARPPLRAALAIEEAS